MADYPSNERVMPVESLQDYFRTSVQAAVTRQNVEVDPHAAHYVVNLLTIFSRADQLYEDHGEYYGLRPLALMLADAVDAPTASERNFSLRRIGDVALFMAGFFADSLANKAVDIDYYINMGENAYGVLSDAIQSSPRGDTFSHIYGELAAKFPVLVDVLNEVRDGAPSEADVDLLRTYDVWLKTGSQRAASVLRENGVVVFPNAHGRRPH